MRSPLTEFEPKSKMEAALDALRGYEDSNRSISAINLINVYFKNIERDPKNHKYRKIRIGNAKFSSTIWELEPARTFLFLCGFEEQGEFLVLPESASISAAKLLLDWVSSVSPIEPSTSTPQPAGHERVQSPVNQDQGSLKLAAPKGGASLFDVEVKPDLTLLSYMVEMGYDKSAAEKALVATKNTGVQPAMDWITLNPQLMVSAPATGVHNPTNDLANNMSSASQPSTSTGVDTSAAAKPAPISRYQKTADERHKFQEKLRLEAIEAARIEKQAKLQHKQYLLREMQGEKEEKKERAELAKKLKTSGQTSSDSTSTEPEEPRDLGQQCSPQEEMAELRLRLPDGQTSMLKLPKSAQIMEIYRHVCRSTEMNQTDFVVMTSYPQMELPDNEKTVQEMGLVPRAALVVQRRDQQGVVTEGRGQVCTVRNIRTIEEWQSVSGTADKLLVVEFYASWCSNCRAIADEFESLNAMYGINQDVLFLRVDVDQLKVLKFQLRITTLPTFKLFWNEREIAEHQGTDLQPLEEQIQANRNGPQDTGEQDHQPMGEEYDDPR